jgi:hypothetical protein
MQRDLNKIWPSSDIFGHKINSDQKSISLFYRYISFNNISFCIRTWECKREPCPEMLRNGKTAASYFEYF